MQGSPTHRRPGRQEFQEFRRISEPFSAAVANFRAAGECTPCDTSVASGDRCVPCVNHCDEMVVHQTGDLAVDSAAKPLISGAKPPDSTRKTADFGHTSDAYSCRGAHPRILSIPTGRPIFLRISKFDRRARARAVPGRRSNLVGSPSWRAAGGLGRNRGCELPHTLL